MPVTPKTKKNREKGQKRQRLSRAKSTLTTAITNAIGDLPNEAKGVAIINALKSSGTYNLLEKALTKTRQPRGIRRTSDETIQKIWKYWNEHSTITNCRTSRPAQKSVTDFTSDSLLSRVDISEYDMEIHTSKRKIKQYRHQHQVQNAKDEEIYNSFLKENPDNIVGRTTFVKIKPFYVRHCKPGDIETCCCRIHVNFRSAVEALIKVLKGQQKEIPFKISEEESLIDALSSYSTFMKFVYKDCTRDGYGLLIKHCEQGDCGHWKENYLHIVSIATLDEVKSTSVMQIDESTENEINAEKSSTSEVRITAVLQTAELSQNIIETTNAASEVRITAVTQIDELNQNGIEEPSIISEANKVIAHKKVIEPQLISFQRFEYGDTEKFGRKLQVLREPMTLDELIRYIDDRLSKFVKHSSENHRDYIFWKIWTNSITSTAILFYIDFSENLSLPIQKEPQSMYWIRKQISILCGIGIFLDEYGTKRKVYFGHMSEDREHDQVYVIASVEGMLSAIPENKMIIIRSDNAVHFKSAENFCDLQELSNKENSTVARVFGTPNHGKSEIDSEGGHLKNPIRSAIAQGSSITCAADCVTYLRSKKEGKTNPEYHIELIKSEDLENEREKRLYKNYTTINGSNSFRVILFRPGSDVFHASTKLCVCSFCQDHEFENCEKFISYQLQVGMLNEKATRSKDMTQEEMSYNLSSMVTKDSVFAVRAENSNTNYFLLMCETEEEEHLDPENPYVDEAGHAIKYGTKYIIGRYLDICNSNDRCHEFRILKKKIAVIGQTIFFPQVPIAYTSKKNTTIKISNEIIHELQVRSSLSTE